MWLYLVLCGNAVLLTCFARLLGLATKKTNHIINSFKSGSLSVCFMKSELVELDLFLW